MSVITPEFEQRRSFRYSSLANTGQGDKPTSRNLFQVFRDPNSTLEYAENSLSTRIKSMLCLILYASAFYVSYRDYVSVEWAYAGLRFTPLSGLEIMAVAIAVGLQGWTMPQILKSPSSVILWFLTVVIYVPTIIITVMIGERDPSAYYGSLFALTISMLLASILTKNPDKIPETSLPNSFFFIYFFIAFSITTIIQIYLYRDIMSFASIDEVYFQRFAASEVGVGSITGYARTHYLYVLSSFMFCSAFLNKRYWYFSVAGFGGYILTYLIDASKISFVIPLAIVAVFAILQYGKGRAWILSAGLALLSLACGKLATFSPQAKLIADLVLTRSIAIPAQTFAQYADVFNARGYTWWSNVSGLSYIVPPPESFKSDPFWPVLGRIVGADFYGAESRANLNANLFAGEGIAAAGSMGIIMIGLAMILYLRTFDALAARWNERMVILVSVPLALSLTNTHLSTFLLSFGGLFWLVVFRFSHSSTKTGAL